MIALLNSAVVVGLTSHSLTVEVDITSGLPATNIVGLADKAVTESKERIRTALKSSGYDFPLGRITVNLAPADLTKSGSSLDVPIALGILCHIGKIKAPDVGDVFVGELSLTGEIRPVSSIINILMWAKQTGKTRVFIPEGNRLEVLPDMDLEVFVIRDLTQLVDHLSGTLILDAVIPMELSKLPRSTKIVADFSQINGQQLAKRALTIAAAGGHNVMLIGDPGTGKTLLSKALIGILPPLTSSEILEVNAIYSAAGLLPSSGLISTRPFRSPHHTSSHVSIVGGGINLRPGEVTLAHRGVLFLDEFPEFTRATLESLRQPMEDGQVTIARASGSVEYPARCILVGAANPTPHGSYAGSDGIEYNDARTRKYREKFSGPLMDRFDLFVRVSKEQSQQLGAETSKEIQVKVMGARELQQKRFETLTVVTNSEITVSNLSLIEPSAESITMLDQAAIKLELSMRAYHRVLKIARTIADLDASAQVLPVHVAEALQFRQTKI